MNITVFGGGAFGTAIANSFASYIKTSKTTIIMRSVENCNSIMQDRINPKLSGVILSEKLIPSTNVELLKNSDVILWCIPTKSVIDSINQNIKYIPSDAPILLCSKGIYIQDNFDYKDAADLLLIKIVGKILKNNPIGVLSGPNIAKEIGLGFLCATNIAFEDEKIGKFCTKNLSHEKLVCCYSDDYVGVQLAGALKNVYSIASGMFIGLGLGQNAWASFIALGLHEMVKIGEKFGAQEKTFYDLAGLGDFVLTSSCSLSRNTSFGIEIAQGRNAKEIIKDRSATTEGFFNTEVFKTISDKYSLKTPILDFIYGVLYKGEKPALELLFNVN